MNVDGGLILLDVLVRKSNNEPAMTLADAYRRASSGTFNIGEPMTLQVLESKVLCYRSFMIRLYTSDG